MDRISGTEVLSTSYCTSSLLSYEEHMLSDRPLPWRSSTSRSIAALEQVPPNS